MTTKTFLFVSVFVVLALVLLIGGHYLLYVFFVDAYALYDSAIRIVLATVLGIFSLSYLIASIIARWSDNVVTRTFYAASAIWLGLILYVAIGTAFTLFSYIILDWFNLTISHSMLATCFLAFAFFTTGIGIWNAYTFQVKHIEVKIKNLPDAWLNKTIVQISDVHLGHVHGSHFFKKLISLVMKQSPDAVFITGDLFDGMGGDFRYIVKAINQLQTPLGTFYIKGNHETYMDFSQVEPLIKQTQMIFLRDEVRVVQGLQIVGADYPPPGKKRQIGNVVSKIDRTMPSILLWHEPTDIETAKKAGISFVLSGHTHRGQMFPFESIARWMYKKYEYGLVTDGLFTQYTSSGVGTWGPPMRIGNRPEIVRITVRAA